MTILGFEGMPRRYATHAVTVGPVDLFTLLHKLATAGTLVLVVGQLIVVWNLVRAWLEGPVVEDRDPWNLAEHGQRTREFVWSEKTLRTTVPDGGETGDG